MDKSFTRYAEVKAQIKALEGELEAIEADLLPVVEKEGGQVRNDLGLFSMRVNRSWKYSDKVKKAAYKVKDLKAKEEEDGTAVCTESKSLRFEPPKLN